VTTAEAARWYMGCGASSQAGVAGSSTPADPSSLVGTKVSILELDRRADLNGKPGVVQHHIKERMRFIVLMDDGESVSISCDKVKAL